MRIRTIKPEFWTDRRVSTWPLDVRLLYIGLWSYVDDSGRGSAAPIRVAAELFSWDMEKDFSATLARVATGLKLLAEDGRISLYEANNERWLQIARWGVHQRIDRPSKSSIPAAEEEASRDARETLAQGSGPARETLAQGSGPARETLAQGSGPARETLAPEQGREQGREQGVGGESEGSTPQAPPPRERRFLKPSRDELVAFAAGIGYDAFDAEQFFDHYEANGWKVGRNPMKDWRATVRNWRRQEAAVSRPAPLAQGRRAGRSGDATGTGSVAVV